jgi:hypothetical protein
VPRQHARHARHHPLAGHGGPDAHVHPEREQRVLPPREPRRDRARRLLQRAALPRARPHVRARREHGDVRVPRRERPHPPGVPLVPRAPREALLRARHRLLRQQRAPGARRRGGAGERARCSATTCSPSSTTTATACR